MQCFARFIRRLFGRNASHKDGCKGGYHSHGQNEHTLTLLDKWIMRSQGYNSKERQAEIYRRYLPWGVRITTIPGICTEGLLDVCMSWRDADGETFLAFVNVILVPSLLSFDGFNRRSIVIRDKVFFCFTVNDFFINFCKLINYTKHLQIMRCSSYTRSNWRH